MSTSTFNLLPEPIWYYVDEFGKPLGAGQLFSYSSLNRQVKKFIFQDPEGAEVFPDPIQIDENGTTPPLYFQFDTANPTDLYYLEVRTPPTLSDPNGTLIWAIDDFGMPGGGGGGGNITTFVQVNNLVTNNVFWRNSANTANPIASLVTLLAPGNHAGLAATSTQTPANSIGPDILFVKNNLAATDQITFPSFSSQGTPLEPTDVTPDHYVNYTCGNSPAGETIKCFQFPMTKGVKSLQNQAAMMSVWMRSSSASTVQFNWLQYFGDGGGTALSLTNFNTIDLTTSWVQYIFPANIPSVISSTIGSCQNDGLFLQIQMPFGVPCSVDMTKPCIFLGANAPALTYQTYDQIDAVINAKRTGFVEVGYSTIAPNGFVIMNDGTISMSAVTPPAGLVSTRPNADTFPLYNLLWNNISNQANGSNVGGTGYAQLYSSSGTAVVAGASAVADFTNNVQMQLTKSLGRAISNTGIPSSGGTGTNWALGQFFGEELHQLTIPELARHSHNPSNGGDFLTNTGGTAQAMLDSQGGSSASTSITGGDAGHNTIQPTTHMNFFIKL